MRLYILSMALPVINIDCPVRRDTFGKKSSKGLGSRNFGPRGERTRDGPGSSQ